VPFVRRWIAQVGLAEMSLRRWIDADTHITAALSRHDSDWIENPKTRETLQKALADVGRHLGRVRIEGTSGARSPSTEERSAACRCPEAWPSIPAPFASGPPPPVINPSTSTS
jgi:hypothetical protein